MKDFHLYINASYQREGTGRCAGLLVDEHENEYHFSKGINDATIKKVYQNK